VSVRGTRVRADGGRAWHAVMARMGVPGGASARHCGEFWAGVATAQRAARAALAAARRRSGRRARRRRSWRSDGARGAVGLCGCRCRRAWRCDAVEGFLMGRRAGRASGVLASFPQRVGGWQTAATRGASRRVTEARDAPPGERHGWRGGGGLGDRRERDGGARRARGFVAEAALVRRRRARVAAVCHSATRSGNESSTSLGRGPRRGRLIRPSIASRGHRRRTGAPASRPRARHVRPISRARRRCADA